VKVAGRTVVGLLTVAFAALAIPFLVLATMQLLNGGPVGSTTILIGAVYAVALIAVVLFWIRALAGGRGTPTARQ
jgi:hypothetical protein